jgi:DNA (cytosine-5)-methyltransferase 1
MKPHQPTYLHEELIVDNFAGGGGASTGIEMALARAVDIAINHDADALAMHKANHPDTVHLPEDVWKVDPLKVTGGRPVGVAWFSPDCKDFSKAKGGKPVSKKIRGLAWVMVKWAKLVRPRVMFLENVEEFQDWGPLLADGTRCPKRKGKTFRSFIAQLRALGGTVEHRELRACDFGAPTIRKRLFMIIRFDGRPIVWPSPTHGKPGSADVESGKLKPWRTAAECIDFSLPCPSIFLTKRQAKKLGLKVQRPLRPATMRRIARGIFKFVINNPRPFIVKVNHTGYEQFRGQSIDEPLQTITAKHPYAVVSPHITKFRTGATGHSVEEPLHTITAGPAENPAGAAHAMGVVAATLVPRYGEREGQAPRAMDIEKPMPTIVPTQNGASLVQATLEPIESAPFVAGVGGRMGQSPERPVTHPAQTITAKGDAAIVQAFLAKHYGGNETPGSDLQMPIDTVTAKDHHAVVTAHIERSFGESTGNSVDAPLGTTVAGVNKSALVTSNLVKLRGTNTGQNVDEPLRTVSAGGNHHAEVRAFLMKYYTTGSAKSIAQSLDEPLHTIRAKACIGLVTVHGEDYVIVDIGMRMLEPRELFLAQGFPPDYVIEYVENARRLPKNAQVRMCGNSVPPPMSEALVAANVPELTRKRKAA